MKASILTGYGSPDLFELQDVAKPAPKNTEVLVKVSACSINSWDWEILMGIPFANRLMVGFRKPTKIKTIGCDIAGIVEAVGSGVTQFKPGDEVFGDISHCKWGGFAEYACVPENKNALTLKPATLSFDEAAAIPQAAVLALQGLRKGKIERARTVLINGASGGVGSFAVPLAKSYGAEVTGVCRSAKMEFVRSLGADHVIDYTQEDFTKQGQQYDLILDMQAHHSLSDYKRSLNPGGHFVMVGGSMGLVSLLMLFGFFISLGGKNMGLLLHKPNRADLDIVKSLISDNKIKPIIDKCFPLSELNKAFEHYGAGKVKGKLVITIG